MRKLFLALTPLIVAAIICSIPSDANAYESWQDSIAARGSETERSLQFLLDSLGYDIDVEEDELGLEVFCVSNGENYARMILEVAYAAPFTKSGYYQAGDTANRFQLFTGSNHPGDWVDFTVDGFNSIGFYIFPAIQDINKYWYSETGFNADDFDHLLVFPAGQPNQYLLCWEDLPEGGDKDFQDLVLKVKLPNDPPEIVCPGTLTFSTCGDTGNFCFEVSANDEDEDTLTYVILEGSALVDGNDVCLTTSEPGQYQITIAVFDVCGSSDTCEVLVNVINGGFAGDIHCPNDTSVFVTGDEQICVPGFICPTSSCYVLRPEVFTLNGNSVCFIADTSGTYSINFVSVDSCSNSDTCTTLVQVHRNGPPVCQLPPDNSGYKVCAGQDICLKVSALDPDNNLKSCSIVSGPGQIVNDTLWCYMPTEDETVTVTIECVDSLGLTCTGTFTVYLNVSEKPELGEVNVTDVFLCNANQQVCVELTINSFGFPFDVSPLIGEFNREDSSICFTADTSGLYCNRVIMTNGCGEADTIEYCIEVVVNSAPVAVCPGADTIIVCQSDANVCIAGFDYFDIDENIVNVEVIGGNLAGDSVCFIPSIGENNLSLVVTDNCGLADTCHTIVFVKAGSPPIIPPIDDQELSICNPDTFCFDVGVIVADYNLDSVWTNIGEINNGILCVTVDTSGIYQVVVYAMNKCLEISSDSFKVFVTINQPPVVSLGEDFSLEHCGEDTLFCFGFSVSDNNLTNVSSNFPIVGSQLCFSPEIPGVYPVWVRAVDECERVAADTILVTVTTPPAPFINLGEDINSGACVTAQYCIDVQTIDHPVSITFNQEGYNSETGEFCFEAGESFVGLLIAQVVDSCGRIAADSISVNIQSNTQPQVQVALRDTTIYLCQPSYVCLPVVFNDANNNIANVTVNRGNYTNGQVCFVPYDSGNYTIIATATDSCGAITADTAVVRIITDQYVNLECPNDTSVFMCEHDTLCFPIGDIPEWAEIKVSGINTWYDSENQQVCFYVNCGVSNRIVVKAITACDTITCEFTVDIECNQPPLVLLPPDTTIILCESDSVYIPVGISDANHNLYSINTPNWIHYEPISSRLIFHADTSGVYVVSVTAIDECEAISSDEMSVRVNIDEAPVCDMPDDTTIYLCQPGQISLPIYSADESQLEPNCTVDEGPGQIVNAHWVYQANASGIANVVVECIDACDNICRDSFTVNIQLNEAPICTIPNDTIISLCLPEEICLPISSIDNDGNFKSCTIVSGPGAIPSPISKVNEQRNALGTIKNQSWCYTPTKDTSFSVVIRCEDSCGAFCVDSFTVSIDLNGAPVVSCLGDTTLLLCSLDPVTLAGFTATDPNGDELYLLVSGGQLSENSVTFTPVIGENLIVFSAYDGCEAFDVCSTVVNVVLNQPPTCQIPNDTTITGCAENEICLPVSANDADGNLVGCQIISGPGVIENGFWCYPPPSEGPFTITIRCTDECGASCEDSFTVVNAVGKAPTIANQYFSIKYCDEDLFRILQITASYEYNDFTIFELLSGEGNIDILGGVLTYSPDTPGVYSFIVDVSNSCGNNSAIIYDTVTINRPPELVGFDSTVNLCSVEEICFDVFGFDPNNDSLNIQQIVGLGQFTQLSKNTGKTCFIPVQADSAVTYLFVFQVTDLCRNDIEDPYEYYFDTVAITVILEKAPVLNIPPAFTIFACNPDSACFRIPPHSPEEFPYEIEVLSGNAVVYGDTVACLLIDGAGDYVVTIKVTDSCGNSSIYESTISVELNTPPQVIMGDDFSLEQCIDTVFCVYAGANDLDGNLSSFSANYGVAHEGVICFEADTSGVYTIIGTATDSCGAIDVDSINVTVIVIEPPVVSLGSDYSLELCSSLSICIPYSTTATETTEITSNATIIGDSLCFFVNDGTIVIWISARDECGRISTDTIMIEVSVPESPYVSLGNDIRAKICSSTEFCIDVNTIPNPASVVLNRVGYNPQTGQFCFTANQNITDYLKVTVTDSCGRVATDSISINVQFNSAPRVQLAMRDSTIYLCQPSYICLPLVFSDAQNNIANITVNRGNYSNGQVCFVPYDSGTYTIIATATDSCGALKSDTAIIKILTDQYVKLDCPNDTTIFMCAHDTLCFPIGEIPSWAQIQITGINSWYNSQTQEVCFYVACGVRNRIVVKAITPCDTISCSFTVDVRCNQPPLVLLPQDTTITLCGPDSVRIPVGITDPNHNIAAITTNSWAHFEPIASKIVFVADTEGVYIVQVSVVDSCGAQDFEDISVRVKFNTPPSISFAQSDSIYDLCTAQEICLPITFFDNDNNITQIIPSVGQYKPSTHEICFVPGDTFGLYCISVRAIDACGKADTATKCITLNNQGVVEVECPNGPIYDTLCFADTICQAIPILGDPDSIKVSYGQYIDGELCFYADTSGVYNITTTVFTPCTTLTCQTQFRVFVRQQVSVTCPSNDTVLVCAPDTVFYKFSSTSVTSFTITAPAFIIADSIGVPVLSSSIFNLTLIGTGSCGADTCAFSVNAKINTNPTVVSADDTTLTDCVIQQFCVPFTVTDPDNNVTSVTGPGGIITGNQYCFTPTGTGEYRIIIRAIDACGAVGVDTTVVRVSQTVADIFCPSGTQTRTVCRGDSVRITVPITPFEANVVVQLDGIPNGFYNRDSALVVVFPQTPGSHQIRLIASAGCVTDTCLISLFVNFLERTTITCSAVIDTFVCPVDIDSICFPVSIIGANVQVTVSNGGRYQSGQVCVPISHEGAYPITIIASGSCGTDTCVTTINVDADDPPTLYLPADTVIELCDIDTNFICIDGIFMEDDSPANLNKICGPGTFQKISNDSGVICFKPSGNFFGDYLFCFEVSDDCNAKVDTFKVTIIEAPGCDLCLVLSIDGGNCIPVGRIQPVDINIESFRPIGGFELLISYDASVSAFSSAIIDETAIDGWEYFNYRMNSGACAPVCPTGLVRLVGLAETNNGANHPPAETLTPNGLLIKMYFLVTNDQNVGGQFLPINFVTYECADNSVSDPSGNDLYVDSKVFNAENIVIWDEDNNLTYPESIRQRGLGTPDSCIVGTGKGIPKRCVEFINGGICVIHPDEIDDRGDINLNGVSYEVADAVVFTNYFIYGLAVFTVNIFGQIAASDINADGITLSVADLVLLIRIIIGDAPPIPKINPHEIDLKLANSFENGAMTVTGESINGIGGAYLVYQFDQSGSIGIPVLTSSSGQMDLLYNIENNELRVLIFSSKGFDIDAGKQELVKIPFEGNQPKINKFDFADAEGRPYVTALKNSGLPDGFALHQNYPNPFNPSTTLSFSLSTETKWELSVFNVAGARVRQFIGSNEAGLVEVRWDGKADDGNEVASGVYFYRLVAGEFVDTKKMIMLK